MQFPFALPTDNKILIGAAVAGVILLVAIAYFMFFRSSKKVPSASASPSPSASHEEEVVGDVPQEFQENPQANYEEGNEETA
jgi:hypothetical protein